LRERLWQFMDDPSALASLWHPLFRAVGIGWTLHRQGGAYLESAYYRELEAPLDSCWILDAMIGDGGRTIGFVHLTRPRSARPFKVDDVQQSRRAAALARTRIPAVSVRQCAPGGSGSNKHGRSNRTERSVDRNY
jgi:hypothetical protein